MPVLNIEGRKVNVSDDFLKLSPEEQNATVDEIAAQMKAPKAGEDGLSQARTGIGGFIEGIPVVGPVIRRGTEMAAAATLAAMDPEVDYEQALARVDKANAEEKAANPIIDTASQVAGGVAGTVPLVMAAPAAFGAGGGGLAARTAASAASGAALGGADAAVRSGGDLDEAKQGAYVGLGMGAVGPALGQAVGAGVRKGMSVFAANRAAKQAGTTPYALNKLGKAALDDGLDAATMQARLAELGPEGMIGDLGPNLRGKTAALANMPGEGNQIVRSAIDARDAGANARLGATINETLGPNVVPSQVDTALKGAQSELSPLYDQVFANAKAVNTQPIADVLEQRVVNLRGPAQQKLSEVRNMLNITGTNELDPNPRTLFETRQAIDGMMQGETNGKVIRNLTDIRQRIDQELNRSVPGVKRVDARFAELAKQRDALERGQQVLDTGRTAPRPAELADEVRQGAIPQGEFVGPSGVPIRIREGARAEIDRILGNNRNDVARLNTLIKGEGDWNRDRLATLFGEERAGKLFQVLQNELEFATTKNVAVGNSATAGRQQHIADLGGRPGDGFGVRDAYAAGGLAGAARGMAVKGAEKAVQSATQAARDANNAELAKLITSNRLELIDAILASMGPKEAPALIDPVVKSTLLTAGRSRGE